MLEHPRESAWLPTLGGLALATAISVFAIPILWVWGSKAHRRDRFVGFAFGFVLNFGIVLPILVAVTGD